MIPQQNRNEKNCIGSLGRIGIDESCIIGLASRLGYRSPVMK